MMKKFLKYLLIFSIVFLGFILRAYKVGLNPAGFFCDEAAIGYNAYSLLKTGADEYGQPFPIFFRSFGAYRNPLPIYFMLPSVALFGLNEFSVRFTSVLAGTLTIFLTFLLANELFDSKVGLFTAFFLAISPWHIHFSRFGSEYIYFPFLFVLGLYLFVLGLRKKFFLPLGFLTLGLTLYTYYPAWLTVPLLLAGLIFIFYRKLLKIKRAFLLGVLLFFLTLIPLIIGLKTGVALTRWNQVSVLKGVSFLDSFKKIFSTYWQHFSLDFLFKKGDISFPRHFITRFSVRGMGELYWFQLPAIIIGLFALIKNWGASSKILFLLLIFYPLGSSLIGTDGGGPFAFRSIFGVIPFQIVSGVGVAYLFSLIKNRKRTFRLVGNFLFFLVFLGISLLSVYKYLYRYHIEYPLYSSDFWGWQYGPREVMKYFAKVGSQYDDFFLMGNFNSPEIFIKFYDPENRCQNRCQIGGLDRLNLNKKQLFAIGADRINEIPKNFKFLIKETIYYPNKTPCFLIGEVIF